MGRRQFGTSVQGYACAHCPIGPHNSASVDAEIPFFWDDDVLPHDADAYLRLVNDLAQMPQASAVGGVYPRRGDAASRLWSR